MIPKQDTNFWIQDPLKRKEIDFNSMDPDKILPEDKERFDKLKADFDKNYRGKLETILWKNWKSLLSKIAWLYEKQDWNFEKAVWLWINSLKLKEEEKQELKELIFKQISNENKNIEDNTDEVVNKDEKDKDEEEDDEDEDEDDDKDSVKDVENEKKQQKIDEWPYSPIVNRFIKNPKIDIDAKLWREIKEALLTLPKKNPEDWEDVLKESLEDALDNLEIDSDIKSHLIDSILYLEKPSTIEKNKQNFEKDFKDELSDFKEEYGEEDTKWDKEFTWVVKDVVETLWSNYFIEWEHKWNVEYEKKKSVDTAFEISANKIIQWKQIKRDFTFETKLENIKNEDNDFSSKLEDLIDLANLVNTKQWEQSTRWKTAEPDSGGFDGEENNILERIEELINESEKNWNASLEGQLATIAYIKQLENIEKVGGPLDWKIWEALTSNWNVWQLSTWWKLDKMANPLDKSWESAKV